MPAENQQSVAVIGAGVAGLVCARELQRAGFTVTVFEKSRGVGGRTSTRRGDAGAAFDHGAQYFTVKDPAMAAHVQTWLDCGVVAKWEARIGSLSQGNWEPVDTSIDRYVGTPAMSAIAKNIASSLNVKTQTRVQSIGHNRTGWQLNAGPGEQHNGFSHLIINAPAPQAAELTAEFPEFRRTAQQTSMAPCWAAMVTLEERPPLPWDAAFVENSPLSWVARNSSKPGRPTGPECWVLHASPEWSQQHLEESPGPVADMLLQAFWEATGIAPQLLRSAAAHRWRYALPDKPLEQRFLYDANINLAACGDWCGGPRVEGALLSGLALAAHIVASS